MGASYALFCDDTNTNIDVTSGKVEVAVSVSDLSLYYDTGSDEEEELPEDFSGKLSKGVVEFEGVVPGCRASFKVKVSNNGTLATKWQLILSSESELLQRVTVSASEIQFAKSQDNAVKTAWQRNNPAAEAKTVTFTVSIELPYSTEDLSLNGAIYVSVNAVQGNAPTAN